MLRVVEVVRVVESKGVVIWRRGGGERGGDEKGGRVDVYR